MEQRLLKDLPKPHNIFKPSLLSAKYVSIYSKQFV